MNFYNVPVAALMALKDSTDETVASEALRCLECKRVAYRNTMLKAYCRMMQTIEMSCYDDLVLKERAKIGACLAAIDRRGYNEWEAKKAIEEYDHAKEPFPNIENS